MKYLVIRADSGAETGIGHVMRCLALAQAWQDRGGTVAFITATDVSGLTKRVRAEGVEWIKIPSRSGSDDDARITGAIAKNHKASWVVVDGYHFDTAYFTTLKEISEVKVIAIDDLGRTSVMSSDLILNQNIYASPGLYPEVKVPLLLGTRYALIRREFIRKGRVERKMPPVAQKILVSMGGSDPDNTALKVLNAFRDIADPDGPAVVILTGYSNSHYDLLVKTAENLPGVRVIRPTGDMPGLMEWADMAITAAGSTVWEMAFMGLPIITLVIAENQMQVAKELEKYDAIINMGPSGMVDTASLSWTIRAVMQSEDIRRAISSRLRNLVDGEGAARVVMRLLHEKIRMRLVQRADCKMLWEWANEDVVRRMSFNQKSIPWEEHADWFEKKIHDESCYLYIAVLEDDTPIGQIRFDIQDNIARVDVSLGKEWRGRNYGSELIRYGIQKLLLDKPDIMIQAHVKSENVASVHAFQKAGFFIYGTGHIKEDPVTYLSWENNDNN